MTALGIGWLVWLAGVCFALVSSVRDGRFDTRSAAEDAVREALIWFLVLLPWREWLPSSAPGKHRLVRKEVSA